jgi:hypothetical protein
MGFPGCIGLPKDGSGAGISDNINSPEVFELKALSGLRRDFIASATMATRLPASKPRSISAVIWMIVSLFEDRSKRGCLGKPLSVQIP